MTDSIVTPYLNFSGRCEEALQFYQEQLHAKLLMKVHFHESPEPMPPGMLPPGFERKIMHAELMIGKSRLFLSDGNSDQEVFRGFALSVSVSDEATVQAYFNALANGGEVQMPVTKTFWSPCCCMVKDRFGVHWLVMIEEPSDSGER